MAIGKSKIGRRQCGDRSECKKSAAEQMGSPEGIITSLMLGKESTRSLNVRITYRPDGLNLGKLFPVKSVFRGRLRYSRSEPLIFAQRRKSACFDFGGLGSEQTLTAQSINGSKGPFTTPYTSNRSQFIRPRNPPSGFLLTGLPLLTHTLIIEEERPEETPPGRFPFLSSDNSDQTQPRRFSRAWCFDVCIPQNIEDLHGFGIRTKRDRDLAD
jgi:hypothetical protein